MDFMAILKRNRSISHKRKRKIVFAGWRRNISGKEKIIARELRENNLGQL